MSEDEVVVIHFMNNFYGIKVAGRMFYFNATDELDAYKQYVLRLKDDDET